MNGLVNANDIYKEQVFDPEDWKVIGEYVYDSEGGRHQAFLSPVRDVSIKGVEIKAGERIQIEESLKYSPEGAAQLWRASGLVEVDRMSASSDTYSKLFRAVPCLLFPSFQDGWTIGEADTRAESECEWCQMRLPCFDSTPSSSWPEDWVADRMTIPPHRTVWGSDPS